jgi:predicted phage tail protein
VKKNIKPLQFLLLGPLFLVACDVNLPLETTIPGAVEAFEVSINETAATLMWSAPFDDGGAPIIKYEVTNSEVWIEAESNITHTFKDLQYDTEYTVQVRAVNENGPGPALKEVIIIKNQSVPLMPQDLSTVIGDQMVSLSWSISETVKVTGFEVKQDDGPWNHTLVANYVFSNLTNGTEYTFSVRAINDLGFGPEASVKATPATIPSAPQSFEVVAGDGQVILSWLAPVSDGGSPILRYEVQKDTNEWLMASSNTGHIFSGLTNGVTYSFKVRAVNAVGSTETTSREATPSAAPSIPSAVQNLVAISGNSSVTLTWSAPASNGNSEIIFYQVRVGGGNWIRSTSSTEYVFNNLNNGTEFLFQVQAVNDVGPGIIASIRATPATTPNAIAATSLELVVSNKTVLLSWTAPYDGGSPITKYQVAMTTGSETPNNWLDVLTTSYTFTELTNGTTYYFYVRAVNAIGPGEALSRSAVPTSVPDAVTDFMVSVTRYRARLTWLPPLSNGGQVVTNYEVAIDDAAWINVGLNLNYTYSNLADNMTYTFKVRAINVAGSGATISKTVTMSGRETMQEYFMRTPDLFEDYTTVTEVTKWAWEGKYQSLYYELRDFFLDNGYRQLSELQGNAEPGHYNGTKIEAMLGQNFLDYYPGYGYEDQVTDTDIVFILSYDNGSEAHFLFFVHSQGGAINVTSATYFDTVSNEHTYHQETMVEESYWWWFEGDDYGASFLTILLQDGWMEEYRYESDTDFVHSNKVTEVSMHLDFCSIYHYSENGIGYQISLRKPHLE